MSRWYVVLLRNIAVWTLVIMAILAFLSAIAGGPDFMGSFRGSMFYFGLFLIVAGGLVGAGFSEVAYYNSGLYKVSNIYMNTINKGRSERRDRQFAFMVYSLVIGFILIFMAIVL